MIDLALADRVLSSLQSQTCPRHDFETVPLEFRRCGSELARRPAYVCRLESFTCERRDPLVPGSATTYSAKGDVEGGFRFEVQIRFGVGTDGISLVASASVVCDELPGRCDLRPMLIFGLGVNVLRVVVEIGFPRDDVRDLYEYLHSLAYMHDSASWACALNLSLVMSASAEDARLTNRDKVWYLNCLGESLEACGRFKLAAEVYDVMVGRAKDVPALYPHALNNAAVANRRAGAARRAGEYFLEYLRAEKHPDYEKVGTHLLSTDRPMGEGLLLLFQRGSEALRNVAVEKFQSSASNDEVRGFLVGVRDRFAERGITCVECPSSNAARRKTSIDFARETVFARDSRNTKTLRCFANRRKEGCPSQSLTEASVSNAPSLPPRPPNAPPPPETADATPRGNKSDRRKEERKAPDPPRLERRNDRRPERKRAKSTSSAKKDAKEKEESMRAERDHRVALRKKEEERVESLRRRMALVRLGDDIGRGRD